MATQFWIGEVASYWLRQVATKPILSISPLKAYGAVVHKIENGGGFTIIHIKTPKKRGARISGLVMQRKVAQLICKYSIPQLEIVSITLIEWFNYVVHRIIWASIFFERKLLSRSFDRHLLKLYWLMKRVKN